MSNKQHPKGVDRAAGICQQAKLSWLWVIVMVVGSPGTGWRSIAQHSKQFETEWMLSLTEYCLPAILKQQLLPCLLPVHLDWPN